MRIEDMKINGKIVQEAKLNNLIVYKKEQPQIELENIIYNSDFRFGTDGFQGFSNAIIHENLEDQYIAWTKINASNNYTSILAQLTKDLIPEHSYYARVIYKGSENIRYQWHIQLNSPNITTSISNTGTEDFTISKIFSKITTQYRIFYNMTATFSNADSKAYMKKPMLVDITGLLNSGMTEEQVKAKLDKIDFFPDKILPILTFVRIQNNTRGSNEPAKVGDTIWVYARVNLPSNQISKAPEMIIAGVQARVFIDVNADTSTTYAGEIKITEDMQDGNIEFKIYGYADLDGNVGETVTQTTDGSAVIIQKINKRNIEKGDNLFNKILYVDIPNDISIEKEEYGDMLNCKAFAINVQFDLEDNFVNCNGKLATFGKTQNDDFTSSITFFSKNKTQINQNWKQIYIKPDENANESDFIVTYVDKTSIIYPYLFIEE